MNKRKKKKGTGEQNKVLKAFTRIAGIKEGDFVSFSSRYLNIEKTVGIVIETTRQIEKTLLTVLRVKRKGYYYRTPNFSFPYFPHVYWKVKLYPISKEEIKRFKEALLMWKEDKRFEYLKTEIESALFWLEKRHGNES